MKKEIILLENKVTRQGFKKEKFARLEEETALEVVLGEDACNNLLDDFMKNSKVLNNYTTIIIHASIYQDDKREKLFDKIKEYDDKNIVIFSGDSSLSLIDNVLKLPAKKLYSENLEIFLKDPKRHLLMLGFGKNWEACILLNVLEKLNLFIEKNSLPINDDFDFDTFEEDVELLEIKGVMNDEIYLKFINKTAYEDRISQEQIMEIQQKLHKYIIELSQ